MSNDEIELEEGEIAEDSDDADSMDNHPSSSAADINHQSAGGPTGVVDSKNNCAPSSSDNNPRPQKRTRKVTRTVKVKKKVKKKVPKRNLAQSNSNNNNSNNNNNINTGNSSNINTISATDTGVIEHNTGGNNNASCIQPIDALWEQQIMMLQEQQRQQNQQQTQHQTQYDQQLSQILRAAAFDEDLRIFLPSQPTNQQIQRETLLPLQQHNQLQQQQQQQLPLQHSLPNFQQPHLNQQQQQQQIYNPLQSYQPHQHLQREQQLATQSNQVQSQLHASMLAGSATSSHTQPTTQSAQQSQPRLHQTPSSPDDESGKSSYEVISKMLTLLRNSTNVHDPSETDSASSLVIDDENVNSQQNQQKAKSNSSNLSNKDYKLIPILIDGIDYTRYKLLSQYEPKFKNDPRLNQNT